MIQEKVQEILDGCLPLTKDIDLNSVMKDIEQVFITYAYNEICNRNKAETARFLGIHRNKVTYKLKEYGIV